MNDDQLERYSRQIMLPDFDYQGQVDLLNATVLIIGLGGLGSPVALYLAAAGVGHLVLVDDDQVDSSNLQRQIVHTEADIGVAKAESAAASVRAINSTIKVTVIRQRLGGDELLQQAQGADLMIDCSDNSATRFAANGASLKTKTPLISGAAIRMEGQVSVFDPRVEGAACYQCVYGNPSADDSERDVTCAANGVLAPLVGIIGSVQAMEAVKLLAGVGDSLAGRLLVLDGKAMQWREFKAAKAAHCAACSNKV